jgi:hypothetical protein
VNRARAALVLVLLALSLPAPARAFHLRDWLIDLTQSLAVEAHRTPSNEPDFQMVREKLTLAVAYQMYRAEARLEGTKFLGLPGSWSAPSPHADVLEAEKLTFEVRGRDARVWVGDFYQVLGRGLLLNLRKMDELGLDTTLRGAKATFQDRELSLTAFGGLTNGVNLDPATWKKVDDPNDLLTGAAVGYRLPIGLEAGLHGLYARFRQDVPPENDHARQEAWGLGASLDWRRLGLYGEADFLRRSAVSYFASNEGLGLDYRSTRDDGLAAFLSGLQRFGPVTLLAEAKWTHRFGLESTLRPGDSTRGLAALPYTASPTLEKEDLRLAPHESALGARARVSLTIAPADAVLRLDHTHFFDPPDAPGSLSAIDPYDDVDRIDHTTLAWEQHLLENRLTLTATGGFRQEMKKSPEPDHQLWYAEASAQVPIAAGFAVDLIARHEDWKDDDPLLGVDAWRDGTLGMTFTLWSDLVLAVSTDYSTRSTAVHTWFPNGSLEWKYTDTGSVKAFGGYSRGGLKCVGGVCRMLPDFDGGWVLWVQRF